MTRPPVRVALLLAALLALPAAPAASAPPMPTAETPAATRFTVAQFNARLYSDEADGVLRRLRGGTDEQGRKVAAIVQRVRPDLLLVNEFDFDPEGALADVFQREYLEVGQHGEAAIHYPYRFFAPVNTGVPSGMDLNGDGQVGGEGRLHGEDSFGFGLQPGQYGMLVLSRFPIEVERVRTFQYLRWAELPGAQRPRHPDGRWWYDDAVWPRLRLSSKSHWDVPVRLPDGVVHLLASHPTPPVFDGPEDRNGKRNADELALWRHYLDDPEAGWLCDDQGRCGGLPAGARFVLAGDLNNDPVDGAGQRAAILALIEHPRVLRHAFPRSEGAVHAARTAGGVNARHRGDPAHDTGAFGPRAGNLQLDYVLPSEGFRVLDSGVFWPAPGQPGADWIDASDHRMVWLQLETTPPPAGERMQQRLVERHAEGLLFPRLVERCKALPELRDAPLAEELAQWRQRRAGTLAEAAALVEGIASAQGQAREAIDAAILAQGERQHAAAEATTLAWTCQRLRATLRGEPYLPMQGSTLDEDTRREVLDELLPVATRLLACETPERITVRPAPPPALRTDASSAAALADRVEMWEVSGCGKRLEVELSLRFPEGEPPAFALGLPRTALPAAR
jgi:hypothetical protein